MLYGILGWSSTNQSNILNLQRLQNKCIRLRADTHCREKILDICTYTIWDLTSRKRNI